MFYYFRNCSSNTHQVCCEDSLIKGLCIIFASPMTLALTQGHNCVKLDTFFFKLVLV